MAVTSDLQRKFKYSAIIKMNKSGGTSYGGGSGDNKILVDDFTPPSGRQEPIVRLNASIGSYAVSGLQVPGEVTLRIALRVQETTGSHAALLDDLQKLSNNDIDTCDITLQLLGNYGGNVNSVGYFHLFKDCVLTGFMLEPVGSRADDDMLHGEITVQPSKIEDLSGDQMGN